MIFLVITDSAASQWQDGRQRAWLNAGVVRVDSVRIDFVPVDLPVGLATYPNHFRYESDETGDSTFWQDYINPHALDN